MAELKIVTKVERCDILNITVEDIRMLDTVFAYAKDNGMFASRFYELRHLLNDWHEMVLKMSRGTSD